MLNISDKTATKVFKQLNKCKLIYENKQGQTKLNLIYVGKINHDDTIPNMIRKSSDSRVGKIRFMTRKIYDLTIIIKTIIIELKAIETILSKEIIKKEHYIIYMLITWNNYMIIKKFCLF